jgi:hypothetical protein
VLGPSERDLDATQASFLDPCPHRRSPPRWHAGVPAFGLKVAQLSYDAICNRFCGESWSIAPAGPRLLWVSNCTGKQ